MFVYYFVYVLLVCFVCLVWAFLILGFGLCGLWFLFCGVASVVYELVCLRCFCCLFLILFCFATYSVYFWLVCFAFSFGLVCFWFVILVF